MEHRILLGAIVALGILRSVTPGRAAGFTDIIYTSAKDGQTVNANALRSTSVTVVINWAQPILKPREGGRLNVRAVNRLFDLNVEQHVDLLAITQADLKGVRQLNRTLMEEIVAYTRQFGFDIPEDHRSLYDEVAKIIQTLPIKDRQRKIRDVPFVLDKLAFFPESTPWADMTLDEFRAALHDEAILSQHRRYQVKRICGCIRAQYGKPQFALSVVCQQAPKTRYRPFLKPSRKTGMAG